MERALDECSTTNAAPRASYDARRARPRHHGARRLSEPRRSRPQGPGREHRLHRAVPRAGSHTRDLRGGDGNRNTRRHGRLDRLTRQLGRRGVASAGRRPRAAATGRRSDGTILAWRRPSRTSKTQSQAPRLLGASRRSSYSRCDRTTTSRGTCCPPTDTRRASLERSRPLRGRPLKDVARAAPRWEHRARHGALRPAALPGVLRNRRPTSTIFEHIPSARARRARKGQGALDEGIDGRGHRARRSGRCRSESWSAPTSSWPACRSRTPSGLAAFLRPRTPVGDVDTRVADTTDAPDDPGGRRSGRRPYAARSRCRSRSRARRRGQARLGPIVVPTAISALGEDLTSTVFVSSRTRGCAPHETSIPRSAAIPGVTTFTTGRRARGTRR